MLVLGLNGFLRIGVRSWFYGYCACYRMRFWHIGLDHIAVPSVSSWLRQCWVRMVVCLASAHLVMWFCGILAILGEPVSNSPGYGARQICGALIWLHFLVSLGIHGLSTWWEFPDFRLTAWPRLAVIFWITTRSRCIMWRIVGISAMSLRVVLGDLLLRLRRHASSTCTLVSSFGSSALGMTTRQQFFGQEFGCGGLGELLGPLTPGFWYRKTATIYTTLDLGGLCCIRGRKRDSTFPRLTFCDVWCGTPLVGHFCCSNSTDWTLRWVEFATCRSVSAFIDFCLRFGPFCFSFFRPETICLIGPCV